jgi:hypothetical protein
MPDLHDRVPRRRAMGAMEEVETGAMDGRKLLRGDDIP